MHDFSFLTSPTFPEIAVKFLPLIIVCAILVLTLKGFALWNAARNSQTYWFVALLIINSLGILEIIYLIWFRPSPPGPSAVSSRTETKSE